MKKLIKNRTILGLFAALLLSSSCTSIEPAHNLTGPDLTVLPTTAGESGPAGGPVQQDTNTKSGNEFALPADLEMITGENVDEVERIGSIDPILPPYYVLSPDGRYLAVEQSGVLTVQDSSTGEMVSQFRVEIPDCAYGFERYFQFNWDGSFIVVVTRTAVQVWQTIGGLIYESPNSRNLGGVSPSCGFDIPQVALSPDGKMLAETGIDYSAPEPSRYFRVVDVIDNKTVYAWDGKDDSLHGSLYGYYGLGFSWDGAFIQTFDQKRFILFNGNLQSAFRFWSMDTWQEIIDAESLKESFPPGDLLFPVSGNGQVEVFDKLTGVKTGQIPAPGCEWDSPCEMHFSSDGSKAILLPHGDTPLQYRQSVLYPAIQIWDLKNKEMMRTTQGLFRNLDGLQVTDKGDLLGIALSSGGISDESEWWVFPDHFQGLYPRNNYEIGFIPTWAGVAGGGDCRFCATCNLNLEQGDVTCLPGIENRQERYSIKLIGDEYWIVKHNQDGEGRVGKLTLQPTEVSANQRLRLLAYAREDQTAFYCLDTNFRQQTCVIDDLGEYKKVKEFTDISYLRLSPDEKTAIFIDSSRSILYLYDLETQKLTKKSHYQAKAAATNPVFSPDGQTLYYLVESLKNDKDFSIEIMDTESKKVEKRVPLNTEIDSPAAFSINEIGDIWAIAANSGEILLFSSEKGELLEQWDSGQEEIIGLIFDRQNDLLVSMDSTGLFQLWGVPQ